MMWSKTIFVPIFLFLRKFCVIQFQDKIDKDHFHTILRINQEPFIRNKWRQINDITEIKNFPLKWNNSRTVTKELPWRHSQNIRAWERALLPSEGFWHSLRGRRGILGISEWVSGRFRGIQGTHFTLRPMAMSLVVSWAGTGASGAFCVRVWLVKCSQGMIRYCGVIWEIRHQTTGPLTVSYSASRVMIRNFIILENEWSGHIAIVSIRKRVSIGGVKIRVFILLFPVAILTTHEIFMRVTRKGISMPDIHAPFKLLGIWILWGGNWELVIGQVWVVW